MKMYQIVLCGDSTELVTPAAASEYDTQISDLPYSEAVHEHPVSCGAEGVESRDFGFAPLGAELRATAAMTAASVRRWSVLYSDLESAGALRAACEDGGAEPVRIVPWIRWSMPQLAGDRPPQGAEATVWLHRQQIGSRGGRSPLKKSWNGPGWLTHLGHKAMRGRGKYSAEKPLDQLLDLVHWTTEPGEGVIDLSAGVGTTALACAILGRRCLAIEIDPTPAATGQQRVEQWQAARELSARDTHNLDRWRASLAERSARIVEIQEGERTRTATWREKHPEEKLPGRLRPSKQLARCLAAMARDLEISKT